MKTSPRNRSFLLRIILFLCVILITSNCSNIRQFPSDGLPSSASIQDVVIHDVLSEQTYIAQWTIAEGGNTIYDLTQVGLGFVRPEDRFISPDQLPQNEELRINTGEPLKLDLVANAAKGSVFLVTALLDYKQIPFILDGQYGLLHQIEVKENGDLYIPIQIDVDGKGAHDLTMIAFISPYNRPWNQDSRDLVNGCLTSGRRAVVIVDNVDKPVQEIQPDVYGISPPLGVEFGYRVMFSNMPALFDNKHPSQRQMRMTQSERPGGTFRYQLWLSNYNLPENKVDYGLVRFLDFHQVLFKGKNLFVIDFTGRQEAIIEDSYRLPQQTGVHEAQIIDVFDPYKSILRREVLAPFVFSSSCLGIYVR